MGVFNLIVGYCMNRRKCQVLTGHYGVRVLVWLLDCLVGCCKLQ